MTAAQAIPRGAGHRAPGTTAPPDTATTSPAAWAAGTGSKARSA
jgi:hypothetical protein